jgi:hypothetical protein
MTMRAARIVSFVHIFQNPPAVAQGATIAEWKKKALTIIKLDNIAD